MARHQIRQHPAIDFRPTRQEGRAEAGGESRLRLLAQALFRAGNPRRIARQEVIHGLRRGKLGDWRQHAKGIRGQHHHIARQAGGAAFDDVRNIGQRIAGTRIFRELAIIQVKPACFIGDHIFQNGAEAMGRIPDLRLGLTAQFDHFGIAAAFEIEDAGIGPAMFIIADQIAFRIR